MKESHVEGVATHDDPESCGGVREDVAEALDRGTGGPGIQPRNPVIQGVDAVTISERQYVPHRHREMRDGPARSETPCTHGTFLHENREICESPAALVLQDAPGRPKGPKPVMYGSQKSDEFVVPMRPSNEAGSQTVEEAAEGRSSAKGNTAEQNAPRTQCRTGAPSALCRVREAVNQVRFECQNPRWEPSAVVPLARICAGGGPRHLSRAVPTAIPTGPVVTAKSPNCNPHAERS
jgi:hypothetical protein